MHNIQQLFQKVSSIGFWAVIFRWKSIKRSLLEGLFELQRIIEACEQDRAALEIMQRELDQSRSKLEATEQRVNDLQRDKALQSVEINVHREQIRSLDMEIAHFKKADETRYVEHQKSMQTLIEIKDRVAEDRRLEQEAMQRAQLQRMEAQRTTWQRHQQDVENKIRLLSERYTIEYVEEFPYKLEPDNALMICNEHGIFDAKSPRGEDLGNFATYLSREAAAAKKYAEKPGVRSDIYFVVPSNTLEVLTHTVHVFEKHRVFVIPIEALETVILNLKRIEDYEFAEQLSPEQRDSICRIIGRLAHNVKRRIQIDLSLGKESMALVNDCEHLLPAELFNEVLMIERAIKVNPPQEKKGKEIPLEELMGDLEKLKKKSEAMGSTPFEGVIALKINT